MPGDRDGQMAVLRAVFNALEEIEIPGTVVHLPFEGSESPPKKAKRQYEPPPISTYLKNNIRQVPKFVRRDIPPEFKV
jgi:hypothetical protein